MKGVYIHMMHKDRLDALTALLLEHQYDAFFIAPSPDLHRPQVLGHRADHQFAGLAWAAASKFNHKSEYSLLA